MLLQLLSERRSLLEQQRQDIDAVLSEIDALSDHCREVIAQAPSTLNTPATQDI